MERLSLEQAREYVLETKGEVPNLDDETVNIWHNAGVILEDIDDAESDGDGLCLSKYGGYPDLHVSYLGEALQALMKAELVVRDELTRSFYRSQMSFA